MKRFSLACATLFGLFGIAPEASADVASFYGVGVGASLIDQGEAIVLPTLEMDLGIGTLASRPIVFGALVHVAPQFTVGLDLGGALRIASGSYARGEWGVALDLGLENRFALYGGLTEFGRIVVGGPWGLYGAFTGSYTNPQGNSAGNDVYTGGLTFGIDFARATVHRASGQEILPSPLSSPIAPKK